VTRLDVGLEVGAKKVFAWALAWPGWCRAGRDREGAIAALLAARDRYASVADAAGFPLPPDASEADVVEEIEGSSGTDFGVPYSVAPSDRRPVATADAERLAALVGAAWAALDEIAARTPATLRKGPRGGGRDRDKVLEHVIAADHAYAREIGIRLPEPTLADRTAVMAERDAVLRVLAAPSDGSPSAGRRWPPRYAARRIAWHALDHAWEMEDRTEP
jgi:hypothetical protein